MSVVRIQRDYLSLFKYVQNECFIVTVERGNNLERRIYYCKQGFTGGNQWKIHTNICCSNNLPTHPTLPVTHAKHE